MSVPNDLNDRVNGALNRFEEKEYASLQWGFVNGAFTQDEIEAELCNYLDVSDPEEEKVQALKEELIRRRLLLEFPIPNRVGYRYRTRFAETVRLLSHLRQLFPGRHWADSPTLVSDFRLIRKPRLYPKRNISADAALRSLQDARLGLSLTAEKAMEALIGNFSLAQFQRDATARILGAQSGATQGTIVCAGTGTGKTLAFYLPCFAQIAADVRRADFDTICLALYPRNELLKDQFKTAFQNARKLDGIAARSLRIAVFNGLTPDAAQYVKDKKEWIPYNRNGISGFVCPFLTCQRADCGSELVWRQADISVAQERLYCPKCGEIKTNGDILPLTRQTIETKPPDVLFTTTEMLNRSLSARKRHKMLGIGTERLRYVLLDEAHTYAGVTGAQNAMVLRRWKRLVKPSVQFVGLSATLTNPRRFFADLIGEPESAVQVVTMGDDRAEEGWEYQIALRGDPASAISLLSTSIQTLMLLARMLDPLSSDLSHHALPGKIFAFTDDLDVTNRFYHNMYSAEHFPRPATQGQNNRRRERLPLASERILGPNPELQDNLGQLWEASQRLGYDLRRALTLDKVSSQDAGVNPNAQIVIATASLEVGFDDDQVGAVVQHKAARNAASFLQRKGRAGRSRKTHPWTAIILSDFGRDRIAYQGYEQLFDPELDRTDLPFRNRYVRKIQAVFALMDYIGCYARLDFFDEVWKLLSADHPKSSETTKRANSQKRQIVRAFAEKILLEPNHQERFGNYLQKALDLESREEAMALLWQPPRALMTAVLPTLIRRMETNFAGGEGTSVPLPEFATANLFSNLLTPEVEIIAQSENENLEPDYREPLGVVQALNNSSPGRVTRRYAHRKTWRQEDVPDHWITPWTDNDAAQNDLTRLLGGVPLNQTLPIQRYFSRSYVEAQSEYLDETESPAQEKDIRIHRPQTIVLQRPALIAYRPDAARPAQDWKVDNTSLTKLIWKSQFHPVAGDEWKMTVPVRLPFQAWIPRLYFCTHNNGNPLRVQRFAIGAEGDLYVKRQNFPGNYGPRQAGRLTVRFTENDDAEKTAGVGFEMDVDAIGFVADLSAALLDDILRDPHSLRDLRAPLFLHRVRTDPALREYSVFDRDWFAQIGLSVFVATATAKKKTVEQVVAEAQSESPDLWRRKVERALDAIFRVNRNAAVNEDEFEADAEQEGEEDEEDAEREAEDNDDVAGHNVPRRPNRRDLLLTEMIAPLVRERLAVAAQALFETPDAAWRPFLRDRLRVTLGGALLQAGYEVAAEFQTAELLVDLGPMAPSHPSDIDADEQREIIWLSESVPGGAGVMEQVRLVLLHDPERFFLLAERALRSSRWEFLNRQLRGILTLERDEVSVRDALAGVRNPLGMADLNEKRQALFDVLQQNEVELRHDVINALNIRLLHSSSNAETDALLRDLMEKWDASESALQFQIDARVFAYLAATDTILGPRVDNFLRLVGGVAQVSEEQRFNAVYAMLWPRGYIVRERAFDNYNPFAPAPTADALLLERRMASWTITPIVAGVDAHTAEALIQQLQAQGVVRLVAPWMQRKDVQRLILQLIATPIETGYLLGYPRITQTIRASEGDDPETIAVTFILAEVIV